MKERQARAILFSAIEGGHPFWAQEIFAQGAVKTIERLQSGGYDRIKFAALITAINVAAKSRGTKNLLLAAKKMRSRI